MKLPGQPQQPVGHRVSVFWEIYADICAIVGIFTLAFLVLSAIHWANTGDYWPHVIVWAFIWVFWFASSVVRRFG